MTLINRLIEEIERAVVQGSTFDVTSFPQETELEQGDSVEWVASTYIDPDMVYIYESKSIGIQPGYFAAITSDGGVTVFALGPWDSLEEAKSNFQAEEGWS